MRLSPPLDSGKSDSGDTANPYSGGSGSYAGTWSAGSGQFTGTVAPTYTGGSGR